MITKIDPSVCRMLIKSINDGFKPLSDETGLLIALKPGGRYDSSSASFTVEIKAMPDGVDAGDPEAVERQLFSAECGQVYWPYTQGQSLKAVSPEDYGHTFTNRGEVMKVVAVAPRSRKYPIIATKPDGKRFKFTVDGSLGR